MRALALMLVVVLSACGGGDPRNDAGGREISGTLQLTDEDAFSTGACRGSGGYSDIGAGTQVTVKDGAGTIIATGSLGAGTASGSSTCVFPFTVPGVPDAEFYSVEVSHRGPLNYSRAELEGQDWEVGFTLGN